MVIQCSYYYFLHQIEVTAGFGLSRYLPFGIFQRFSVLCHRHGPDDYDHWQNGFHMNFDDVHIQSNVMRDHRCETLQVTARAPNLQVEKLWKVLLTLLEVCYSVTAANYSYSEVFTFFEISCFLRIIV